MAFPSCSRACFGLLVLVACVSLIQSAVSFQSEEHKLSNKPDEKVLRVIHESIGSPSLPMMSLYKPSEQKAINTLLRMQKADNSECSCSGYGCSCCVHLDIGEISLHETGCVNISYLPDELGMEFTLSINNYILIDEKISVKNPPALCAGIPDLEKYASACVKFHDLDFKDKTLSGCVDMKIQFLGDVLVDYELGCFHIPPTVNGKPMDPASLELLRSAVRVSKRHKFQTVAELMYQRNSICACQGYNCGCCLHLEVEKVSLNQTGCLNISYLPSELGLELMLSLNGKLLIDRKVSVKNPPAICAGIPYVKEYASLCVKFRDLDFKNKTLSGCAAIEVELAGVIVKDFDLGCFHIPPESRQKIPNYVFVSN